jgi:hypothetical protein
MAVKYKKWDLSFLNELDEILKYFSTNQHYSLTMDDLYVNLGYLRYSQYDPQDYRPCINACIRKLRRDNFLSLTELGSENNETKKVSHFEITIDALLFLETTKSYKNKFRIENLQSMTARVESKRNSYLFWLTICIAVYTGSQGIFNGMETIRIYYPEYLNISKTYVVPICFWAFLLYISWIALREFLKYWEDEK